MQAAFRPPFQDITAMAGTSSTMCRRRLPEGMKWKSTQLTELDTYRIEMQASYRGRRILRHITVSYGWMSSSKAAADHITKCALDYAKHKAAVRCGIDIGKRGSPPK